MTTTSLTVSTIGFAGKSARAFFEPLRTAGIRRVLDIRLHNTSQLAGFAKRNHLEYLVPTIIGGEYQQVPLLAPSPELFHDYKKAGLSWNDYVPRFLALMAERRVEDQLDPALFDGACLLCSEQQPHCCHRRLVAEYLQSKWGNIGINHLV